MCFNPLPKVESIEGIAERMRGLNSDQRRLATERVGADLQLIEQYLASPKCGSMAEAEMRKFETKDSVDASVGFVSVAAGVMLATQVVRDEMGSRLAASGAGNTVRFSFLNPTKFGFSNHLMRPDCDCAKARTTSFQTLWPDAAKSD
jgi:hypothetical protein